MKLTAINLYGETLTAHYYGGDNVWNASVEGRHGNPICSIHNGTFNDINKLFLEYNFSDNFISKVEK